MRWIREKEIKEISLEQVRPLFCYYGNIIRDDTIMRHLEVMEMMKYIRKIDGQTWSVNYDNNS